MENSGKLFEALSKAQGQIKAALKTAENPAFKKDGKSSTYADIFEVIEVIKEPASSNGLAVKFNFKSTLDGQSIRDWIQYIISHSSGESFVSDWLYMRSRGQTQHDFGASNTYYRRQLLKAIYQIPEDDDDGNSQSLDKEKPTKPKAESKPEPKKREVKDALITPARAAELFKIVKEKDISEETFKDILVYGYKKQSTKELLMSEYDEIKKVFSLHSKDDIQIMVVEMKSEHEMNQKLS